MGTESMSLTRRDAILGGAALAGVAALVRGAERVEAAEAESRWDASYSGNPVTGKETPGEPGKDYQPTVTPNGSTLPFKVVDGVKVFHLVAEEVDHEYAPGLKAKCWGYNGAVHGPTIEDRKSTR